MTAGNGQHFNDSWCLLLTSLLITDYRLVFHKSQPVAYYRHKDISVEGHSCLNCVLEVNNQIYSSKITDSEQVWCYIIRSNRITLLSSLCSTPDFESGWVLLLKLPGFSLGCLRQLSICTSSLVKHTYEFKTASSHAPYFIEVEYLKRSTHSKPHKPFLRRLLCPKNKISYAISYYRRLHQTLELPLTNRQGRSGKQAVHIYKTYVPLPGLLPTQTHFLFLSLLSKQIWPDPSTSNRCWLIPAKYIQ